MNKKKFAVLALLMIVIVALTSCLLAACNQDNPDDSKKDPIKATEGLLISNSDFKVIDTSVSTYPRSVTSWTGAKQYSSGSFNDDVTAGVISLEAAFYNANKSKWGDSDNKIRDLLLAGGKYGESDAIKNALMIYMPKESTNSDGKKIHGPTAYGYTSTSFSLDKGSYYKLTVDVLTYDIGGNDDENKEGRGARIYLSSNTYAEFAGIDTKGEWQTFTTYIETSPSSTTSLTLLLGLGKYSSSFKTGLTTGYAFFDNVMLEKIENDPETDVVEGKEAFDAAIEKELDGETNVNTATHMVPNGRCEFGPTVTPSSSGTPNSWAHITGNSGKDDPAPTSRGHNATIDLSQFAEKYKDYSPTFQLKDNESTNSTDYVPADALDAIKDLITDYSGRVGNKAFMLSQQYMTAQAIRSSRTITIEKNKVYALSIELFTYGIHGEGVSLILTSNDGKDIVIKGISSNKSNRGLALIGSTSVAPGNGLTLESNVRGESNGGWTKYTFYIQGNQFDDYNYNMAVWLGTGGTGDNTPVSFRSFTSGQDETTYTDDGTFSNGWVFIDELTLEEIASLPESGNGVFAANKDQTLDCAVSGKEYHSLIVDLKTQNLLGQGDGYILSDAKATNSSTLDGVATIGKGAPQGWTSNFDTAKDSNPVITDAISEGIVDLSSEGNFKGEGAYPGLPYEMESKNAYEMYSSKTSYFEVDTQNITIKANQIYRLSVWVKTVDVSSTSGAYVYLVDKSKEDGGNLTSFTKINTDETDEYHNDWCKLTIVIRGTDEDRDVALRFTLGTGNRWAASTLTKGALFVTNLNMTAITYANFTDTTTGTYVKSVDLSKTYSYTFKNGSFDDYDMDDENLEENVAFNQQQFAAKPNNWTINDNTVNINKNDTSLFGGIIALNPTDISPAGNPRDYGYSQQAGNATGISEEIFNNFYNNDLTYSSDYLNSVAGPNMLAIGSKDSEKYAVGFASQDVTLDANAFYSFSVYAKTVGPTTASIFLTGESSASTSENGNNFFVFTNTSRNGNWTKYTFYIEVGSASVSLKLNLWLGQDVKFMDVQGADEDADEDAKKEAAKSSGAVFFDKVVFTKIEEDDYNKAEANNTTKKISFLTDSFDSLSSTIESRKQLTTPIGWTGATDTSQSSSNSKYGVIYADPSFHEETESVNGTEYVRILGANYTVDDVTITDEELAEAQASGKYGDMSPEDLTAKLKEEKVIKNKTENWLPVKELYAHSGNRMLVINNTVNSAYIYTSGSKTLKENSYYRVSVWVRTYGIGGKDNDDTVGANIELYLGSANESNNPFIFKAINTAKDGANEWTEYEFFVQTRDDDVKDVTIKLSLGKYSKEEVDGESVEKGLTKGYAMFDDVTIELVDEESYNNAVAGDTTLKRQVAADTSGKNDDDDDNKNTTPSNKFNIEYLWWMIPTIIIGLAIIVVVIVFIVRKVRKPVAKKIAKKASAPANSEAIDRKHSKYDEGKE